MRDAFGLLASGSKQVAQRSVGKTRESTSSFLDAFGLVAVVPRQLDIRPMAAAW